MLLCIFTLSGGKNITAMAMHPYSASLTHNYYANYPSFSRLAREEKKYLQFLRCLPSWAQKLF